MPAAWRVVGASVEGTRHQGTLLGCQDAHRFSVNERGLIVAVADGAGSARRAGEGARIAVAAVHDAARAGLPAAPDEQIGEERCRELAAAAVARARQALEDAVAAACECAAMELGDFATTVTLVVATSTAVYGARVGDGAVALHHPEGVSLALAPDRSEYLNETSFVTSRDWQTRTDTFWIDATVTSIDGIAALTDGLQVVAFDLATGEAHAPFFEPLYAFARSEESSSDELARFLGSERVNARTDDDKTLVVACRA